MIVVGYGETYEEVPIDVKSVLSFRIGKNAKYFYLFLKAM